jgi:fumarylacetoacetase
MEALKPFAVDNYKQEPEPFPYLRHQDRYTFDVDLTVAIKPQDSPTPSTGQSSLFILRHANNSEILHEERQNVSSIYCRML